MKHERRTIPVQSEMRLVWHDPRPTGATGGEFDDFMVWIPAGQLYGRMIAAGVLP